MARITLTREGDNVVIRNGRLLGSLPAESAALPLARQVAEKYPKLESRAYKAALYVDQGHVALTGKRRGLVATVQGQQEDAYRIYSVEDRGHLVTSCSCYDYRHDNAPTDHKGRRLCKHILALCMVQQLGVGEAPAEAPAPTTRPAADRRTPAAARVAHQRTERDAWLARQRQGGVYQDASGRWVETPELRAAKERAEAEAQAQTWPTITRPPLGSPEDLVSKGLKGVRNPYAEVYEHFSREL